MSTMQNKEIFINDTDRISTTEDSHGVIYLELKTTYNRATVLLTDDKALVLVNDLLARMRAGIVISKSMTPLYQALKVG